MQQGITIHKLLAKLRLLHRKAKTSHAPEVMALKALLAPRSKASLTSLHPLVSTWPEHVERTVLLDLRARGATVANMWSGPIARGRGIP